MCHSDISIVILNAVKNPSVFLLTLYRSFASLRMTAYVALPLNSAQIALILIGILLMSFAVIVSQLLPGLAALL